MHPAVRLMLRDRAQRQAAARGLAAQGRHGDSILAHITPAEALLLKAQGGAGTRNPRTGLLQFYVGGGPGGLAAGGDTETGRQATDRGSSGAGGYGNATGDRGSGLGAGGGHSGSNYTSQQFGNPAPQIVYVQQPAAPSSNMPGPPVATAPMMSNTATTDLTGGRFGALPSWATTPYQIGTAPTSYPTPGVNTNLGLAGVASPVATSASGPASGVAGATARLQPSGTLTNAGGQTTNLAGQVLPYQPNAVSMARNVAPNASNAAVAQLLAAAGVTPKPAAQPTGPSPVSPIQQAALAALGVHPTAQAKTPVATGGPMTPPAALGGLGSLVGTGGLGGLGGMPPKSPVPQPQTTTATRQQNLIGLLTGQAAPKAAIAPAPVSKSPPKTGTALLPVKPATTTKKPAGKTNR